jgi:very-short-patch-repair endonuclease
MKFSSPIVAFVLRQWGRLGGGQMHKRTTPKIFKRAKELRRELTPIEIKLWARLRAHRMQDVHFRKQHAIGNYIVDFCAPRKKLIIELDGTPFGRNIWNRKNTMQNELHF